MIKYALQCDSGHAFESWFDGSDAFDKLRKRRFVECPACGSTTIEKQIMAPRVRNSDERRGVSRPVADAEPAGKPDVAPQPMAMISEEARQMRAMIAELHAKVTANTVDVGEKFAEEARRIHYGEVEDKAIRGRASLAEAMELHEEGIGVMPLPSLPDGRN